MKKVFALLCVLIISLTFVAPVYAGTGDGNLDGGGGGGIGDGTGSSFWNSGQEGVRVTVIKTNGNTPVNIPIDFTNKKPNDIRISWKYSKIHYRSGTAFVPSSTAYSYKNPDAPLPKIISENNGNANIDAIKHYFCSEWALKEIANVIGTSFETLTNGKYKLLLEPVVYITYKGKRMAMTATEAAMYDQKVSGKLSYDMHSLTRKNFPLSMFLEVADLGFPNYTGSKNAEQSNATIISSLGLGIVKFREDDGETGDGSDDSGGGSPVVPPPGDRADYDYHTGTDVVTSVRLIAGAEITPSAPASVTFRIGGSSYTVNNIVIPANDEQLVWVKWHTPTTPQAMTINVSTTKGTLSQNTIVANITKIEEKEPPNPQFEDSNPGFSPVAAPNNPAQSSNTWGVWSAVWRPVWEWVPNWVWQMFDVFHPELGGQWVDFGSYVDNGFWEYTYTSYRATLSASANVKPDSHVPTARGKTMGSGYGVNLNVSSSVACSAPGSHWTQAQTAVAWFPEFGYQTYNRVLTGRSSFAFKPNRWSTYNAPAHFTPLWMPDGPYTVYTYVEDVWTPAGELAANLTDTATIDGTFYDDWHCAIRS